MDRAKVVFLLILSTIFLYAEQVEVTADDFFADEKKLQSDFTGNVRVKKGEDRLNSNKLTIYFDKNKNPIKYIATGDANFTAFMREKHYKGSGNQLIYEPNEMVYTVIGNGFLQEIDTDKRVYGDKITVNQKDGTYFVNSQNSDDNGSKKPVKFIFQVEEKKK